MDINSKGINQKRARGIPTYSAGIVLAVCLIAFAAATWFAVKQPSRPDPFAPLAVKDYIRYPIEQNAFLNYPKIQGAFNDVFVVPKSSHVWAVGDAGLVMASRDNGWSWEQIDIKAGPPKKAGSPSISVPKALRSLELQESQLNFNLVPDAHAADYSDKKQSYSNEPSPQQTAKVNKTAPGAAKEEVTQQQQVQPYQKTLDVLPSQQQQQQQQSYQPSPDIPKQIAIPDFKSIFFFNETHGWIVGTDGRIFATQDGGQSWRKQYTNQTFNLLSIYFIDQKHGWACGESNTLLVTVNSGTTWQQWQVGTGLTRGIQGFIEFTDIFFLDHDHGWICGSSRRTGEAYLYYTSDGGKTWHFADEKNTKFFDAALLSVFFIDTQTGWASGKNGTILATRDGGKNWTRQKTNMVDHLAGLFFWDKNNGRALAETGKTLTTSNGGRTWNLQPDLMPFLGSKSRLRAVHFNDQDSGWACTDAGTLMSTSNGGNAWQYRAGGPEFLFTQSAFYGQDHGWIASESGSILATKDGGRSWTPLTINFPIKVSGIQLMDNTHGWILAEISTEQQDKQILLRTTDGGKTWISMDIEFLEQGSMISFHFTDGLNGWAGTSFSLIYMTRDGGRTWEKSPGGSIDTPAVSFFSTDSENGWVYDESGNIYSTKDGGHNWRLRHESHTRISALHFSKNKNFGWGCGRNGMIFSTKDAGENWDKQVSNTQEDLLSIFFIDPKHGWASGKNGTLISTANGGETWYKQRTHTQAHLNTLYFTSQYRGLAAGSPGAILLTRDGGKTWSQPGTYRFPALWYWIVCLGLVLVCLFVVQKGTEPWKAGETVADLLASDRPLGVDDPDPLNFGSIALGLAQFISNVNTDPPLTIAVTGEWGTGKSSLMNLLYHDLKKRRFRPVWFNAWHHQKGEQLLASLYALIREQAVPPLWHPAGFLFRLRLLYRRIRRNPVLFVILVCLVFAAFPILKDGIAALWGNALIITGHLIHGHVAQATDAFSLIGAWDVIKEQWIGALIASPAVAGIWKAIRAFGLSPKNLLVLGTSGADKKAGLDPGARSRFTKEFDDVAASLDLGAMVIFIDDLDRCSKENVVEILETINFLAVSGNCFIVLGMARQWVETCVALQFKELAEETGTEFKDDEEIKVTGENEMSEHDGFRHRQRFARQYLEKLINIEVPVPIPSPDSTRALLTPEIQAPDSPLVKIAGAARDVFRRWAPLLALIILGAAGWWVETPFSSKPAPPVFNSEKAGDIDLLILPGPGKEGELIFENSQIRIPLESVDRQTGTRAEEEPSAFEIVLKGPAESLKTGIPIGTLGNSDNQLKLVLRARPKPVPQDQESKTEGTVPSTSDTEIKPVENEVIVHVPVPESGSILDHWPVIMAGILLGVIVLVYLVKRPQRFTSDSNTFREALGIWHPWIILVRRTPRTIKRFLNRLRYVAMRLRTEPEHYSLWERFQNRLTGKTAGGKPSKTVNTIPDEPVLVALGAIHHVNPDWVKDPDRLKRIFTSQGLDQEIKALFTDAENDQEKDIHAVIVALRDALHRFEHDFELNVDELLRHRKTFLNVLAETGM